MPTRGHNRPKFRLELLETRTLLAGDPTAITSSAAYLTNFDSTSLNSQVVIAGTGGGELNIDATLLPNSIKSLSISGFDKVTINGSDQFSTLDLSLIGTFVGTGVDVVDTLTVSKVTSLTLHSIAGVATLTGQETRLEVFDSRSAIIYTTLDHLTVNSSNDLIIISGNPNQKINLEFPSAGNQILGQGQQVNSGDLTSDSVHTFTGPQSTYNIVVLSLAATNTSDDIFLSRLQEALKKGDPDGVKSVFSDYLKTVGLSDGFSYAISFPVTTPSEINLAEVSRMMSRSTDSNLAASAWRPALSTSSQLPDRDVLGFTTHMSELKDAQLTAKAIGTGSGGGNFTKNFWATSRVETVSLKLSLADQIPQETSSHSSQDELHPMIDRVRSTLSTLVTEVDSNIKTVSAYIIGRLGTEFDPGVQPGLLVEAKAARSGRETEWFQV